MACSSPTLPYDAFLSICHPIHHGSFIHIFQFLFAPQLFGGIAFFRIICHFIPEPDISTIAFSGNNSEANPKETSKEEKKEGEKKVELEKPKTVEEVSIFSPC